jgi:hypothetical protein
MAYSKVRWISTPAFLAYVGGVHVRGEGANGQGGGAHVLGGRMRPKGNHMRPLASRMRPSDSRMRPHSLPYAPLMQAYAPFSQPYAPAATPTIQHGSDVAATVNKVSPDLSYPRSIRRLPLSDRHEPYQTWQTDGRTHRQPWPPDA